jgi:hypothetical protein
MMVMNAYTMLSYDLRKNASELVVCRCVDSDVGKKMLHKFCNLLKKSLEICILLYGTYGKSVPLISGRKTQYSFSGIPKAATDATHVDYMLAVLRCTCSMAVVAEVETQY